MSDDEGLEPYAVSSHPVIPPAGRRRVAALAAAGVAVAAAGMGGGFAAGWASHSSPAPAAVSSPGGSPPTGYGSAAVTTVAHSALGASTKGAAVISGSAMGVPAPQRLSSLGRWSTTDGITIRAFEASNQAIAGGSAVPAACYPTGLVTVELSDTEAVAQSEVPLYQAGSGPGRVDEAGLWGTAEGSPAAWAVISTSPSIRRVSVTFSGGDTDTVAPVHGLAVVASRISSVPQAGLTGTVQLDDSSGRAATVPLAAANTPMVLPACMPAPPTTTTLPPAGPQPADVTTAKAGVEKAIGALFGAVPSGQMFDYVQGADAAVEAAQKQAATNNPNAKVGDTVQQVVFTSPGAATVQYTILLNGSPVLSGQIGQVVLDSGVWKVTRASACGVFALGGGHC